MKTARERVEIIWNCFAAPVQKAIDEWYGRVISIPNEPGQGKERWFREMELSFKEHARDQRHLCAEQAIEDVWDGMDADAIQRAILNTKAPGES